MRDRLIDTSVATNIDGLESFIVAAAQAGINVERKPFTTAIQTTLDAIGHEL